MAGIEAQIEAVLAEIREVKGDIQRMANILDDPDSTLSEQKESSINIRLGGLESRLAALTNLQTELIRQRASKNLHSYPTASLLGLVQYEVNKIICMFAHSTFNYYGGN